MINSFWDRLNLKIHIFLKRPKSEPFKQRGQVDMKRKKQRGREQRHWGEYEKCRVLEAKTKETLMYWEVNNVKCPGKVKVNREFKKCLHLETYPGSVWRAQFQ